jgi:ureidoacrylate peracid hydrolase
VRGSDHLEIGKIKEVVAQSDQADGHVLIARGILHKDTYVPLDAVVKRTGRDVFINVPKIVAGKMPWDKPPTRTETRGKYGARASEVKALYGSQSPSAHC